REAGSDVPLQLQVFDGSGRLLAGGNAQSQGNSPVPFHLDELPAGATIYLGISAAGSHGAGLASPIEYQLWLGLQSASCNPGGATGSLPCPASAVSPVVALVPAALSGFATPTPTPAGGAQPPTSTATAAASGSLVVGGPAQIRAAQPSGGLLSPENTATDGARETPTPESRSWA